MKRLRLMALNQLQVDAITNAAVIKGRDQKGPVEITITIDHLLFAASEANRVRRSYQDRKEAKALEKERKGTWQTIAPSDALSWAVGSEELREKPTVVVTFDNDTEREISFRLSPDAAAKMGQQILQTSEQCIHREQDRTIQ